VHTSDSRAIAADLRSSRRQVLEVSLHSLRTPSHHETSTTSSYHIGDAHTQEATQKETKNKKSGSKLKKNIIYTMTDPNPNNKTFSIGDFVEDEARAVMAQKEQPQEKQQALKELMLEFFVMNRICTSMNSRRSFTRMPRRAQVAK